MKNGEKEEKKGITYNSQNLIGILEKLQRKDYFFEEKEEKQIKTVPEEELIKYLNEVQKTVLKWSMDQK